MIRLWKDLLSYLPGVWQHRWAGFWTTLVIGILSLVVVLLLPTRYEANARVQLDTQSILKPLMDGLAVQPNVDQQVQMMARTLVSRPNVERVAELVGMLHPGDDPSRHEQVVIDLMNGIKFRPSGGSNFYSVTYRDRSPEAAQTVVEAMLTIFREANVGDRQRDNEAARRFIDEQLAVYEKRLLDAENALKDFKVRNLNLIPNLSNDYVAQTTDAQKELAKTRLELRQLESANEVLRRQLADERPSYETSAPMADFALGGGANAMPYGQEGRLDAARKQLEDVRLRFTDEHPDVVRLRTTIKDLEARQAADRAAGRADSTRRTVVVPNRVYQDLKIQMADNQAKIAALRAKLSEAQVWLADARKAASVIPRYEAEYTQLTRDYDVNKKSYDQLLQRREAAGISDSMGSDTGLGVFRVIDPPFADRRPAPPQRHILMLGALALSLAAGLAMTLFRDASMPTFRDPDSVRDVTGLPLLGSVSLGSDRKRRAGMRRGALVFTACIAAYLAVYGALIGYQMVHFLRA